MTFTIIGNGNMAWFIGTRLVTGGLECRGVYSRNEAAAKELATALACVEYGTIDHINDRLADVCFLTVSDSAISSVAATLRFHRTVLVHTAGAVNLDAVKIAAPDRAVLWPVYSILKNSLPDHRNIPCAYEASSENAKKCVLAVAHAITDVLFEAQYEQRRWLHLGAVIGNNFTNHLLAICDQICKENDLPFSALLPIIGQTFERVNYAAPASVQTGPAVRRDTDTINEQLAMLAKHTEWQNVYKAITESIEVSNK